MLTSIYMIAITAEAMSGALAAGRRNMDLFGVALIAFLTALGGGTVRDILLGNFPVTWTQHPRYIYMTIAGGLMTIVIARFMRHLHQLFLVLDAIGLVAFTVIGCNVALKLGYDTVVVVMSGITTGIFGGILRDIMCNRTPQVLRHELYASVSLVVALLYLALLSHGVTENITLLAAFSVGLLLRMAAIHWKVSLPVFRYSQDRWD
ncbi:trimeric intracellular cation channel family protein [Marinobacter daepoensis]|uniref:Trimeric intracellular cation channel family protein n=2 Tax=Marinobacter daepoensis TaxID=262077 RepID=A0ABS3BD76_9GAMM|nr:trimeric intracellular cation channel family protein [Marinobacter daepoensis]MBY6032884.1 trimeric intracellular cation channel family protein [Marinobacter daepoensis]MBY6079394.1 trimeric intracellular cation channel family protein [Marinobacter daepoensis]